MSPVPRGQALQHNVLLQCAHARVTLHRALIALRLRFFMCSMPVQVMTYDGRAALPWALRFGNRFQKVRHRRIGCCLITRSAVIGAASVKTVLGTGQPVESTEAAPTSQSAH